MVDLAKFVVFCRVWLWGTNLSAHRSYEGVGETDVLIDRSGVGSEDPVTADGEASMGFDTAAEADATGAETAGSIVTVKIGKEEKEDDIVDAGVVNADTVGNDPEVEDIDVSGVYVGNAEMIGETFRLGFATIKVGDAIVTIVGRPADGVTPGFDEKFTAISSGIVEVDAEESTDGVTEGEIVNVGENAGRELTDGIVPTVDVVEGEGFFVEDTEEGD